MKRFTPNAIRLFVFFTILFSCINMYAQQDTAAIESKASFPGGINGWRKYLERNLHYPDKALQKGTQGIVRVQMTVDENGKITSVSALNDPGDGLAEEAIRVIKDGPDWTPAMQKGNAISNGFVQKIIFSLGGSPVSGMYISRTRFNQSVVVKTKRLYKGQPIINIVNTEDLSGINVFTSDMKSFFLNRNDALQQLSIVVNDRGMIVPEGDTVVYHDNNGVATNNYSNLKFVGGNRFFRISSLYKKGTKTIDPDKVPIIILNGKEVTAEEIEELKLSGFRGSNLLILQDEPAMAKLGEKGKRGILFLSTKLPYPDNYLYLLNGEESTNEEMAKLPPGSYDTMRIVFGPRNTETYGEKAKYGVVTCNTHNKEKVPSSEPFFTKATTPAIFPGGEEGWKKYLSTSLKYPKTAQKKGAEGEVRLRVMIQSDGTVLKVFALNDPGYGLAQEAVRLIKEDPKWTPANMNGKSVAFAANMTVPFRADATNYF